jgi:hypothetical protein
VADDGEAVVAEGGHQGDALGRHLALRVALAERAAGLRGALGVALEVADDDRVRVGQGRRDGAPADVGLGEAVQQEDGRPGARDPRPVARRADLDAAIGEPVDARGGHAAILIGEKHSGLPGMYPADHDVRDRGELH